MGAGLDVGVGSGSVNALLVFGGEVYAAGVFNAPDSTGHLARWDGSWHSVGGGLSLTGGSGLALAALNGDLFVGGIFDHAGGVAANYIAKWNGTAWSALGSGMNNAVYALATKGTRVYAGGVFTFAGGAAANRIAYWDMSDSAWHAMGDGFSSGTVFAIAVTEEGTVYAGGDFLGRLAKWEPPNWTSVPDGPSGTAKVKALFAKGNDLYVGGQFTQVGSPAISVAGLAKLSGTAWSGFPSPPWQTDGTVNGIAWNGPSQMYVTGGLLNNNSSSPMKHIFVLENGTWSTAKPSPGLDVGSGTTEGHALAVDRFGGHVYVGGYFDTAGGILSPNVASWDEFKPITIVDLGSFHEGPDGYPDSAHGINNSGVAVGESYGQRGGGGVWQIMAYRWTAGTLLDLGVIGSGMDIWASAINDSGQIVGAGLNYLGQKRGARWTAIPGQPLELGILVSGVDSEASALNKDGFIAGTGKNSSSVNRALRWDSSVWTGGSSIPADLTTLRPGGGVLDASYGYGINTANRIVGKSVFDATGVFHAFRTRPDEAIDPNVIGNDKNDLGTISGTGSSEAQAINDLDEVVGAANNSVGEYHAFLKAPNTPKDQGFTDLGILSGHNYSIAYGVNNKSQVVGYSKSGTVGSDRAFLWHKGGLGIKDLNSVLAPGSGWTLRSAEWINDSGKIVGWGVLGGDTKSFLLDPTN
jgi:probable HAF family extracellular repeat protein